MIREIDDRIRRALGGIRLAFRGVGALVNSSAPVQLIDGEGLKDENIRGAELMQHYGFTSTPPAGYMYVAVPIGGKTAHSVLVATEHASYRIKGLQSGEVAIYTDEGDSIVLKRGRVIEVTTETFRVNAGAAIELNAPTVTANAASGVALNTPTVAASANVVAQGEISDHGSKTMSGMRSVFDGHNHNENNVLGGPTATPNQSM